MKNSAKIFGLVFVSLFLADSSSAQLDSFLIYSSGSCPDVDGNNVIWIEREESGNSLYGYNLIQEQKFLICENTVRPSDIPKISGNTVVWTDERNLDDTEGGYYEDVNYDIYGFDLINGTEFPIATGAKRNEHPDISGNFVAWSNDTTISLFNLVTQEETVLNPGCGTKHYPVFGGNKLAWYQYGTGVFLHDLTSGENIFVSQNKVSFWEEVATNGEIVAWQDWRNGEDFNGEKDIYGYNFSTGEEFPVCLSEGEQGDIHMSGDMIVWADSRDEGPRGIYGYDLNTSQEFLISEGYYHHPNTDGELIVWEDHSGNIYGAYIPEPTTLILLLAGASILLRKR